MVKSAYFRLKLSAFIIRRGNEIIKIPILCLNKVLLPQQLQFSRGTRNLLFKMVLHRTIFDASQRRVFYETIFSAMRTQ